MAAIPLVQTTDRTINQLQQNIAQAVQPLLSNAQNLGGLLTSISLNVGSNTINHGLDRTLQGWSIVRLRSTFAQIYDTQDSNQSPSKTLLLTSDTAVVVDIYVF